MMDAQIEPGCFILGDDLSVLDLYVTVTSRWGRGAFYQEAPKRAEVVRRVKPAARKILVRAVPRGPSRGGRL